MKTLWFALMTTIVWSLTLGAAAATHPTDVQSPHPYPNNLDESYYLEAPDGADEFDIHFAVVDLEADYDFLYVRDGQGNLLQTLTGLQHDFMVHVPDHQAMLQLVTDYSVTRQGFVVDALVYDPPCECITTIWAPVCGEDGVTYGSTCWADCAGVGILYTGPCVWRDVALTIESAHPYANHEDQVWTVQAPEPTNLYELTFEDVDLEANYDFLRISNMGRLVAALTGDLGSQVITVPFDEARLHFQSDYSVTRWGFRMTGYRYLDLDGEDDACVPEGEFADPADVCCSGLDKVKDCLPDEDCPRHEYWCVDCGNGTCDDHENWSTCPDDCEAPEIPDCQPTGCSGQICAAEPVITTCEWVDYYACYQDDEVAVCGYDEVAGECAWMDAAPDSLAQCMNQASLGVGINETCGTIMGKVCDPGLICNYQGDYPDAGGTCEEEDTWHTRYVDVGTPHPYENNTDETYEITVVGAEQIRAHFSEFELEYGYDYVTIDDFEASYTGTRAPWWTPDVAGDTIQIHFYADYLITEYGFDIDKVEYYR